MPRHSPYALYSLILGSLNYMRFLKFLPNYGKTLKKSIWYLLCLVFKVLFSVRKNTFEKLLLTSQNYSWWRWGESNSWPPACKAGALRTELHPHSVSSRASQIVVGLSGLEPPTSRLSGVRSNHLSYKPSGFYLIFTEPSKMNSAVRHLFLKKLLRKEVIQPHLPIRLPCYDFTPIINPTFGSVLLR